MSLPETRIGTVDGPEPLRSNVADAKNFNPADVRKEYADKAATWQQYLDLLEMDATNMATLLDRHGDSTTEPEAKFTARKQMAVVFNLIPSIINMIVGYAFSEEPQLDPGGDKDLEKFLNNCDGQGTAFKDFMRLKALPLALIMGQIDALVQNPIGADDFPDEASAAEAGLDPRIFPITPLQRINWSCKPSGEYNWLCFQDLAGDNPSPLIRNSAELMAYITIAAAGEVGGKPDNGYWIRSTLGAANPSADTVAPSRFGAGVWNHTVGYAPNKRCGVATLYYRQSIDPRKRHTGVSKIAMMAVLTRAILNVLSWTQEDILSNLAILALPSKGGRPPKDDQNNPIVPTLTAATILYYDPDNGGAPQVVQGEVAHIKIKMDFVAALVQEVLRVANLLGAEATGVRSGVAGLVERNELFQELSQIAGGMDSFGYDVLALAKSWATNTDVTADDIRDAGVRVNFHKGPYTLDPLKDVIQNARNVLGMFAPISPTMATAALRYAARSFLYANDPDLEKVLEEIKSYGGDKLALLVAATDKSLESSTATIVPEGTDLGIPLATPPAGNNVDTTGL